MKVYQDLTLLPDSEISPGALWSELFQKMHAALVDIKNKDGKVPVGLAFPQYRHGIESGNATGFPLGLKLRAFGSEENDLLNLGLSLGGLSDYIHKTGVRTVPAHVSTYAVYSRYQPKSKSSQERLIRRLAQRENCSLENARALYDAKETVKPAEYVKLPFLQMLSKSSSHRFPLFIEKKQKEASREGCFSTYGLSDGTTTVPDF
jgi:CRISPR-associated endonuclease Csy4